MIKVLNTLVLSTILLLSANVQAAHAGAEADIILDAHDTLNCVSVRGPFLPERGGEVPLYALKDPAMLKAEIQAAYAAAGYPIALEEIEGIQFVGATRQTVTDELLRRVYPALAKPYASFNKALGIGRYPEPTEFFQVILKDAYVAQHAVKPIAGEVLAGPFIPRGQEAPQLPGGAFTSARALRAAVTDVYHRHFDVDLDPERHVGDIELHLPPSRDLNLVPSIFSLQPPARPLKLAPSIFSLEKVGFEELKAMRVMVGGHHVGVVAAQLKLTAALVRALRAVTRH